MTSIIITCRRCGHEFAPDKQSIVQGPTVYRLCPGCRAEAPEPGRCRECGRPLAGTRDLCLQCAGLSSL
jgi:predicted amidophosphoribosyltransferase